MLKKFIVFVVLLVAFVGLAMLNYSQTGPVGY